MAKMVRALCRPLGGFAGSRQEFFESFCRVASGAMAELHPERQRAPLHFIHCEPHLVGDFLVSEEVVPTASAKVGLVREDLGEMSDVAGESHAERLDRDGELLASVWYRCFRHFPAP